MLPLTLATAQKQSTMQAEGRRKPPAESKQVVADALHSRVQNAPDGQMAAAELCSLLYKECADAKSVLTGHGGLKKFTASRMLQHLVEFVPDQGGGKVVMRKAGRGAGAAGAKQAAKQAGGDKVRKVEPQASMKGSAASSPGAAKVLQDTGISRPSKDVQLPISAHREEILRVHSSCPAFLLLGETGSGKSTQLAKILADTGHYRVVCSEPRVLAATTLARRVAEELAPYGRQAQVGCATTAAALRQMPHSKRVCYTTHRALLMAAAVDPWLQVLSHSSAVISANVLCLSNSLVISTSLY